MSSKINFSNNIKWEFKNLTEMGFVKKSGSQYYVTQTIINICRPFDVQKKRNNLNGLNFH